MFVRSRRRWKKQQIFVTFALRDFYPHPNMEFRQKALQKQARKKEIAAAARERLLARTRQTVNGERPSTTE